MILIPDALWRTALIMLAGESRSVERVAYLDGFRSDGIAVATTVTVPNADRYRRWFRVKPDAMSEAGKHLLKYGMRRLVQLHTHGDNDVDHSKMDDVAAYSQRPGAISIVVPFHASDMPDIVACGVHLRVPDGWSRLTPERVSDVLGVIPSVVRFLR